MATTLTAPQFLNKESLDHPEPVYLFCPGKGGRSKQAVFESVLADRAVERIIQQHVDPSLKDMCCTTFYADETAAEEVVQTAMTFPFLAERRVVVVRNADAYESESAGKALHRYLEEPAESTILVLVAPKIDRRQKFYKACTKAATIVECGGLREDEVKIWARKEIEARGKGITIEALRELIDRTGLRLSDVSNAITLLCNYLGEREEITAKDVAAACADVHEEEIWTLTDAIATSDTTKALETLRELIEPNKNEFMILGTINWLLKSAYGVAAGGEAGAKVNPYNAKKVKPLADKLGYAKFRDAFNLILDTDIMFRSTGVDRGLALELLVVKLAAPQPKRR